MKILQINNALRIKNSDNLNWTIEGLKVSPGTLKNGEPNPKAGDEMWKTLHHYPKLEYACMKCIDMQVAQHSDDAVTLENVVVEIKEAKKAIVAAIANMAGKEVENKKELITEAAE